MEDSGTNDEAFLDLPREDVRPSTSGTEGHRNPEDEGAPDQHPDYGLDRDDQDFEAGAGEIKDEMSAGGGKDRERLRESAGTEPPYEQMFERQELGGSHGFEAPPGLERTGKGRDRGDQEVHSERP